MGRVLVFEAILHAASTCFLVASSPFFNEVALLHVANPRPSCCLRYVVTLLDVMASEPIVSSWLYGVCY
jgi:hypothetical protein